MQARTSASAPVSALFICILSCICCRIPVFLRVSAPLACVARVTLHVWRVWCRWDMQKKRSCRKKCSVGNFCRCAVSYSVPWQSAALRGCLLMLRWPGHVDCWFRYVPQSDWQRFGDGYRKSGGIKTCRIFLWFLGYCVRHFGFRMPFISITAEWPPYRRQAWLVAIWCWR